MGDEFKKGSRSAPDGDGGWKPFRRPSDVIPERLEQARINAEADLQGLPGMSQYLKDSEVMPKWDCESCGTENIPCAQGECLHCNNPRPFEWRDPEQGEDTPDGDIGDFRKKARGQQTRIDPLNLDGEE